MTYDEGIPGDTLVELGDFAGAVEVECPECGADPGQQCSDIDGKEMCTLVHAARIREGA